MYYSGLGVVQDKEKARALCQLAAKEGSKLAELLLERLERKKLKARKEEVKGNV